MTQFGLARGGSLLRIDIDPLSSPPPTPPLLLPRFAGAGGRAATVVAVAASIEDGAPLDSRARLRITDGWDDPFVWPNEVNQVHY